MSKPIAEMIAQGRLMMERAHAPYSNFRVAAVLKGANGKLYAGCNVENASYPESCCAESSAISVMIADGEKVIAEVLVMAVADDLVTPCGGCRQKLREFASDMVPIYLCSPEGVRHTVTLGDLLPLSFGPDHLKNTAKL